MTTERQLSLTKQIAPLAEIVGESGLGELGKLAGTLATTAGNRSDFDLANLATVATREVRADRRGELADPASLRALNILQHQAGFSLEKSLAFEATAINKGLGSKDVEKFADALIDPMADMQHPAHLTHANIDAYKFAHMDRAHRLDALLHDKRMVQAVLKNREATRFAELGSGAEWGANEAALIAGHTGEGVNAGLIAQHEEQDPQAVLRRQNSEKQRLADERAASEREGWKTQLEAGKRGALDFFGRNWLTEFGANLGAGTLDLAHGLLPKSNRFGISREFLQSHGLEASDPEQYAREQVQFNRLSSAAEAAGGGHAAAAVARQHEHALAAAAHPQFQTAPVINVAAPVVHVTVNTPSRPRVNDVHRDYVSPSAALGANH
jgi:hypothetical protein